jgi:hypothetical protein
MNCFGIDVAARVLTQSIGKLGIKFAEVIHPATAMVNKYIISNI